MTVTVSPLRLETWPGPGRSASSFTKHLVGAYIRSTSTGYVDIISCWSLLYGVYDGGSKNMFVQ